MGWHYDEMRQVGVDFENSTEVAEYDSNQGSGSAAELGLISRAELEITDKTYPSTEYAEQSCTPTKTETAREVGARR